MIARMTHPLVAAVRARLPGAALSTSLSSSMATSLDWVFGGFVGLAACALLIIGLGSLASAPPTPSGAATDNGEPTIAVLLFRDPTRLEISAGSTGEIVVTAGRHRWRERGTIELRMDGSHVLLGERRLRGPLHLRGSSAARRPSPLSVGDRLYQGEIVLHPPADPVRDRDGNRDNRGGGNGWRVVNRLPLEDYLCGVIGSEMPLAYPRAALRAQAVAARSYARYQIAERGSNAMFHLTGDSSSQVYGGHQRDARAVDAVRDTRGTVLLFRGRVFECFYHSTCGGATASGRAVFGAPGITPLTSVTCGQCPTAHYYRWQAHVERSTLERILRPVVARHRVRLGRITALEPIDRQPGGHAGYVRVRHTGGSFEMDATRWRDILTVHGVQGIRSTSFTCRPDSDGQKFELSGRGWGHGVGLCQHGARGRARTGEDWRAILNHYYPGSEPRRLW